MAPKSKWEYFHLWLNLTVPILYITNLHSFKIVLLKLVCFPLQLIMQTSI